MTDIGNLLKEAREARGVSVQTVEEETKISSRNIKALEENNYQALPGKAYAIGFLRIYGKYLDLNSDDLVAAYKELDRGNDEEPEIKEDLIADDSTTLTKINRTPWQKWQIGILLAVIILVATGGILYYWGSLDSPPPVGQVNDLPGDDPDVLPPDLEPPVIPGDEEPPDEPLEPVIQGLEIEILATNGPCWMRVEGTGWSQEYNLKRGDNALLVDDAYLKVRYGNASAIEVRINGITQEALVGTVVTMEYFAENNETENS